VDCGVSEFRNFIILKSIKFILPLSSSSAVNFCFGNNMLNSITFR